MLWSFFLAVRTNHEALWSRCCCSRHGKGRRTSKCNLEYDHVCILCCTFSCLAVCESVACFACLGMGCVTDEQEPQLHFPALTGGARGDFHSPGLVQQRFGGTSHNSQPLQGQAAGHGWSWLVLALMARRPFL